VSRKIVGAKAGAAGVVIRWRRNHWLAHTILAIHATSAAAIVRSDCVASSGCNSTAFAVRRFSVAIVTSPALLFTTTRSPLRIGVLGETRMTSPSR